MADPRTAVVLVGQNPTPALLSSLTLPADDLALVGSDGTRVHAARVADALARLRPRARVSVESVGPDPHDFGATARTLDALHRDRGGRPWSLDYTGGTKVMSVAAALHHEQALTGTGDPARHRYYLDPVADLLRAPDGSGLPVDSDGVDLGILAGIHGARWLSDRDPRTVRIAVGGGVRALRAAFPDLPPPEVRGVLNEAELLRHLRRIARGRPGVEVLGPRRVADPRRPDSSTADFDALVRIGHRVLCVEVKSSPEEVVARAGWTVAKARRVFGNVAKVLFVHAGPAVSDLRRRIGAYTPALSSPNVQVWNMSDLRERLGDIDRFREAFFPGTGRLPSGPRSGGVPPAPGPAAPPRHHPGPGDGPVLVTSLGSSRLGTLTAVHAHRPARTLVLSSRQGLRSGVRDAAARTLHAAENPGSPPADAALLREAGYRDRVRFTADPVDGFDAEGVAAAAQAWIEEECSAGNPPPVVADITTGTKAMSLGLAMAARRSGACIAYQLIHERSVVCLPHGRIPLRGRASVDWQLALPGYTPLEAPPEEAVHPHAAVDTELLAAAARALIRAARGPVQVWADETLSDPEACLTAQERPSLVLTFDDRAVGLSAPAWHRRVRGDRVRQVRRGTWAQSVHAATTHLSLRCDVAGKVVALSRPGGDVSRAVELVDWITHSEPEERQAPRLEFGEPLRPLVVVAEPRDVAGALDTDVGEL